MPLLTSEMFTKGHARKGASLVRHILIRELAAFDVFVCEASLMQFYCRHEQLA